MSVRTLLLGLAACAAAAPAFAATDTTPETTKPMKHSMATHASMSHGSMSHKGHMMAKGKTMAVSPDNSADELNARSLQNAQGSGGAMPAPMTPAPAKSGGGT